MNHILVFLVYFTLGSSQLLLGVEAPQSRECIQATKNLDSFFSDLSLKCEIDNDCIGVYARIKDCSRAVVIAKPQTSLESNNKLLDLQKLVRSKCPSVQVACSPIPYRAKCIANRCVDLIH